ncbi:MAG: DUF1569 domain-containing protein [Betaproteobacteria bacterium]|nr:DUF1569 domain-containing protein [Betaproteobacteria bacterium]
MKRRDFLGIAAGAWVATAARANAPAVQSLDEALRWVGQVEQSAAAHTRAGWPLAAVIEHLAQSIEFSLSGFPQARSALFQHTLGAGAFAVFKWRGRMHHDLTQPIPGAPALTLPGDLARSTQRLRAAITRFDAHSGPLMPHFAYGPLSKGDYAIAHTLHIANHQDDIVLSA